MAKATTEYTGPAVGDIVLVIGTDEGVAPAIVTGGSTSADGTWVNLFVFPSCRVATSRWAESAEAAAELLEEADNDATSVAYARSAARTSKTSS